MNETELGPEKVDRPEVRAHDPQWRQTNKYRMRKFKGQKAFVSGGIAIDASRWLNVRPPGVTTGFVLNSVEKYLKHPKPGCRYVWRARSSDETIGMVEAHSIRPVKMDEIERSRLTASLHGFAGPDGVRYVGWKRMALFEVPPDIAYEWFDHPVDWAIAKTLQRPDQFEAEVEEYSRGKMEGSFEKYDTRNARQELANTAPKKSS